MPSQTPKQHRAMEAAAHGKSSLGIPKSVGRDFVAADQALNAGGGRGKVERLRGKPKANAPR